MRRLFVCSVLLVSSLSVSAVAAAKEGVAVIPPTELTRYWTPSEKPFSPTFNSDMRGVRMSSEVEVEYTINKRGRVRDVKVLAFAPEGSNPNWAAQAIKAHAYLPAEGNTARTPIRTQTTVRMQPRTTR